ncbi:MAG: nucleotidyl transferase AbiEii/AbiGii toxin family protein [Verrucomicrobiia bacterium]
MNRIASMSVAERRVVFTEAAERLQIMTVIVEKDFWVCWMLGLLFGREKWSETLVFKGGTALSKVFGIIRRFSEDIDLSVSPTALGISEAKADRAVSRRQRDQWMKTLEEACGRWVTEQLQTELEREIFAVLGQRTDRKTWLAFESDPVTHSPVLYFNYPTTLEAGAPYIHRSVKFEFGSLTNQRPVGRHRVQPWLSSVLPAPLAEVGCDVVALEVERAFWEKATILHAEYHRDLATPMPGNYSRHYADVAAMANRPEIERTLTDDVLREQVVAWKARFFARSWARYDLAKTGTFRLVPPAAREPELARDYQEMRDMFLDAPVSFDVILETLRRLEARINRIA